MKRLISLMTAAHLFLLNNLAFGQDGDIPPPPQGPQFGQTIIMISIALLFFYLILWRPEQKRRKALETQRSSLKKGDKVTAMGIVGTVSKVQDETIILRMIDGSKIEFLKGAINDISISGEEEKKEGEK